MTDSDSAPEDSASSTIYVPRDQLDRIHDVHEEVQRHPDCTALWRTLERGLDELERKLPDEE